MKYVLVILVVFNLILGGGGCARKPERIEAQYVSPLEYKDYSCSQLSQELRRISREVRKVTGDQSGIAKNDSVAVGVGLVFWPAFLFLLGDDRAEELALLKGEAKAAEQAAITKDCSELLQQIEEERKIIERKQQEQGSYDDN